MTIPQKQEIVEATGHTPGKWFVDPDNIRDVQADGPLEIATTHEAILRGGVKPPADQQRANARLIAAGISAPHKCEHEDCPGNRLRKKLEAAEALVRHIRIGHASDSTLPCTACVALAAYDEATR